MSNNTRIAKNTLMLYFRQIIILLVGLYTVRVKLDILGVEDYGIYNIVGGIVGLFSIITVLMTNTTQRFLSYALGENDNEKSKDVFSVSIVIHIVIALIFIILAESIGLLLFYKILNLPDYRHDAAFIVYQLSALSVVFRILTIPYSASVIAHEKMSFYAFLGLFETILKLVIVFLLSVILIDKLILYSALIVLIYVLLLIIHYFYCVKNFEMTHFRFCKDKIIYKQISSFTGWTFISNIAKLCEVNGVNVVLNMFFGVLLNAAIGIAHQVNSTIFTFVSNFQKAFRPQLVKYYAAKDTDNFMKLLFRSSKFSYYLLFLIVLPFFLNAEFILHLWLKNVPDFAVIFTQLMLLASLENSVSGTLLAAVNATGNIKKYHLVASFIMFLNLPISYFLLKLGFNPLSVLILKIILSFIILLWQIFYLKDAIKLPVLLFIKSVLLPILIITLIPCMITGFTYAFFDNWIRLLITCIVSTLSICFLILFFGIDKNEKILLFKFIKNKISSNKKDNNNEGII